MFAFNKTWCRKPIYNRRLSYCFMCTIYKMSNVKCKKNVTIETFQCLRSITFALLTTNYLKSKSKSTALQAQYLP